jgi:FtsZ-binding cell division protein ZapB
VGSDLKDENRRLKRHVNKLIRMNDYLKNQLVQGEAWSKKYSSKVSTNPEIEILKMEINYLHESNR